MLNGNLEIDGNVVVEDCDPDRRISFWIEVQDYVDLNSASKTTLGVPKCKAGGYKQVFNHECQSCLTCKNHPFVLTADPINPVRHDDDNRGSPDSENVKNDPIVDRFDKNIKGGKCVQKYDCNCKHKKLGVNFDIYDKNVNEGIHTLHNGGQIQKYDIDNNEPERQILIRVDIDDDIATLRKMFPKTFDYPVGWHDCLRFKSYINDKRFREDKNLDKLYKIFSKIKIEERRVIAMMRGLGYHDFGVENDLVYMALAIKRMYRKLNDTHPDFASIVDQYAKLYTKYYKYNPENESEHQLSDPCACAVLSLCRDCVANNGEFKGTFDPIRFEINTFLRQSRFDKYIRDIEIRDRVLNAWYNLPIYVSGIGDDEFLEFDVNDDVTCVKQILGLKDLWGMGIEKGNELFTRLVSKNKWYYINMRSSVVSKYTHMFEWKDMWNRELQLRKAMKMVGYENFYDCLNELTSYAQFVKLRYGSELIPMVVEYDRYLNPNVHPELMRENFVVDNKMLVSYKMLSETLKNVFGNCEDDNRLLAVINSIRNSTLNEH